MAQERLTMRKIAEVLRLKWECGLSNRTIARVVQSARSHRSRDIDITLETIRR
jgi:hypothetical protein